MYIVNQENDKMTVPVITNCVQQTYIYGFLLHRKLKKKIHYIDRLIINTFVLVILYLEIRINICHKSFVIVRSLCLTFNLFSFYFPFFFFLVFLCSSLHGQIVFMPYSCLVQQGTRSFHEIYKVKKLLLNKLLSLNYLCDISFEKKHEANRQVY